MSELLPTGGARVRIIAQDFSSLMFGGVSATVLAFNGTFGGELAWPITIALMLIVIGVVFSMALRIFKSDDSPPTSQTIARTTAWGFFALFVFVIISFAVPQIKFLGLSAVAVTTFYGTINFRLTSQNALTGAFIFIAILIPNAEEQFFRGFWGNLAIKVFGRKAPILALFVGGAIFATFHFAVYGLNWYTLGILFLDGATMIMVDSAATGKIITSILAHMLNNSIAFGVGAGIVGGALPFFPTSIIYPLILPIVPVSLLCYRLKKGTINIGSLIKSARLMVR